MIPKGWQRVRLGDVCEVLVSNVDKKSNESEIPIKLCNYTDVYKNEYITNRIRFMKATATQREIDKFKILKGDVIITKDSETPHDIAVPSMVKDDFCDVVCGYHLAILRPRSRFLSGGYLNKLLQIKRYRHYFFTLSSGATRFGLSIGAIKGAKIPLPPLAEQKCIAAILSTCDAVIATLEKLSAAKCQLKRGLMSQLLTGKRRLPGCQGAWREVRLGDVGIFSIESGGTPNSKRNDYWGGDIAWITLADFSNQNKISHIHNTQRSITQHGLDNSSAVLLPVDTILISSRATIGVIGINKIPLATNQGFKNIIINNKSVVSPFFLANMLMTKVAEIKALSSGGTFKEISKFNLSSIKIPLPPLAEQKRIAAILSTCDAEIETIEKLAAARRQQKRGLMQQLLTGKIRMRV